uniref:Reverse transcriptase domain-containing protein n=1 Tax=Haemonchus contortus TaxID=6289 RepID=A0A7I4XUN0_HAECO
MLANEDKSKLEELVQTWSDRLAIFGLRVNVRKADVVKYSQRILDHRSERARLYQDQCLVLETNSRVNGAWLKWRLMTDVLFDKNMLQRLKSKIYRTVIQPVAIYGAKCWPATQEAEAPLSVMETTMLRWTAE